MGAGGDHQGSAAGRAKTGRRLTGLQSLAMATTIIAAALSIIAYLIGWFGGEGRPQLPTSGAAEYADLCSLDNDQRAKWAEDVARFRSNVQDASSATSARDALLLLTEQDIQAASTLWASLDALTPANVAAEYQEQLLHAWSGSLSILRAFRDRLTTINSVSALISLSHAIPRSQLEQNAIQARALLIRLGGLSCHLAEPVARPVADLSAAVTHVHWHHKDLKQLIVEPRATAGPERDEIKAAIPPPTHRGSSDGVPATVNPGPLYVEGQEH
jgi:hypothetical protein